MLAKRHAPPYAVEAGGHGLVSFAVECADESLVRDVAALWMTHAPFELRRHLETDEARRLAEASDRGREEVGEWSEVRAHRPLRSRR